MIDSQFCASPLLGEPLAAPRWHILRVLSGAEQRIADRLALAGIHTAYPTKKVTRKDAQGRPQDYEKADVPGWLFARFKQMPKWHEMKRRNLIVGIVCKQTQFGPIPYEATDSDVRIWMGLPTVEEELEAARREAMRVRPGDQAKVLLPGDMELAVTVTRVSGGRVFWEIGSLKGDTDEARCFKQASSY